MAGDRLDDLDFDRLNAIIERAEQNNPFYGLADDAVAQVLRVITYRGTVAELRKQLAISLPVGVKCPHGRMTITVEQCPVEVTDG
mgnify:CR=1 FL=1